jgi:hypothetical protein
LNLSSAATFDDCLCCLAAAARILDRWLLGGGITLTGPCHSHHHDPVSFAMGMEKMDEVLCVSWNQKWRKPGNDNDLPSNPVFGADRKRKPGNGTLSPVSR